MKEWIKQNAAFINIALIVATLIASMLRGPAIFVWQLSQKNANDTAETNNKSIAELRGLVQGLAIRVTHHDQQFDTLNSEIAKEFPRRAELQPWMKSMEEKVDEANRNSRLLLERYRRP